MGAGYTSRAASRGGTACTTDITARCKGSGRGSVSLARVICLWPMA